MNAILRNALMLAGAAIATQAAAEVTFYEHEGFKGRSFNTEEQVANFKRAGFNDRASSVIVDRDWWQVCEDAQFVGRCVVLRPGKYESLGDMGLNDRVSSVRLMSSINPYMSTPAADDHRFRRDDERNQGKPYRAAPVAAFDFHRRYNEQTYEAKVTSVRAVVGPPEQRCWVEREQIVKDKRSSNAPGAIVGALIGGILGHQIGGGSGKDLATAGGAVAGAFMGANVNRDRNGQEVTTQDVQHCANTNRYAQPEYWNVTYVFRGQEHRLQMTENPGTSVTVNERGEPRE